MAIKFLNTVQVDTDVLYVDTTNSNVGIGTTSPSTYFTLDVNGSANFLSDIQVGRNATALSFDMNPGYDSGNYYLSLYKNQTNDGGIILKSKPTSGGAQNDWQIVNQGATGDLKFYAYGLAGNALVLDRETGSLQLPEYGAGTLVSDASGNITVSSGGGAGGPYLPLAGGTLTGALNGTSATFSDNITSTSNGGNASIYINSTRPTLGFTDSNSFTDPNDIYLIRAGNDNIRFQWYDDSASTTTETFSITSAGNATFAGNITGVRGFFNSGSTNVVATFTSTDGTATLQCADPNGNVEFGASGNNFVVQPAGGVAQLTVGASSSTFAGDINIKDALLSNQENTDIDTGAEVVAEVAHATYTAAFFDFVIKKGTNIRSGTVYACHDGTNVEFTETSTADLGDTSDVVLSVDKTSTNLRLLATVASDDWSVKTLIRAI